MLDHTTCLARWDHPFTSTIGIEEALAELTCHATRRLEVGPAARARLHTLVAVSTDAASAEVIERVLARRGPGHPSRLVRVRIEAAAAAGVRAEAAVHCHLEGELRQPIVFETVEVAVGEVAARHLAEVIAPVLEADLPVILWWSGRPPFGERHFLEALALVDRLVVDSATIGLAGLEPLVELLRLRPPVSDLAWGRLEPWREVVANAFDAPPLAAALTELRAVEVDHRAAPVEARLLVSWLAATLGWQVAQPLAGDDVGHASFVWHGSEIPVTLRQTTASSGVQRLRLAVGDYHLRITTAGEWADVRLTRSEGSLSERRERLVVPDDAALLARTLARGGRDGVWEATMRVAASLGS
jgi:glucose-6-phosphate dehydrogenase assembly protein OpcA